MWDGRATTPCGWQKAPTRVGGSRPKRGLIERGCRFGRPSTTPVLADGVFPKAEVRFFKNRVSEVRRVVFRPTFRESGADVVLKMNRGAERQLSAAVGSALVVAATCMCQQICTRFRQKEPRPASPSRRVRSSAQPRGRRLRKRVLLLLSNFDNGTQSKPSARQAQRRRPQRASSC